MNKPLIVDDLQYLVNELLVHCEGHIKLAAPLGLGKPNRLLNAIYNRVKSEPLLYRLTIYTALSLKVPVAKNDLEKRFLNPFVERHFGSNYPQLNYLIDRDKNNLPANITIHEFYFSSGSQLNNKNAQMHYISQNYTHVARDLAAAGINVIVQQVAKQGQKISLSSNPDVTLDLIDEMKKREKTLLVVGHVNPDLPFLGGEALVDQSCFDWILDDSNSMPLFAVPREKVSVIDHAIGLNASCLIKDGGTLQIGIGALSDAIVNALILRQKNNKLYQQTFKKLGVVLQTATVAEDGISENTQPDLDLTNATQQLIDEYGDLAPFKQGLYGATEMVMDGFMHLREAGILKREVFDDLVLQQLLDDKSITNPLGENALQQFLNHGLLLEVLENKSLNWLKQFGLVEKNTFIEDDLLCFADGERLSLDLSDPINLKNLSQRIMGRKLLGGRYLEGAFYLGSKVLYQWLKQLNDKDWNGLWMRRVSHINELLGGSETLDRMQRKQARFFNTCMMHTLTGAAISDGLEDTQVVSGVGGQYNFVAMAHSLDDGRSIIMLRSTRKTSGGVVSNIRWNYGHITIPRHLRDIVITEYGIADLRGQSDQEVIKRMLAISDSRFQIELLAIAKAAGKIATDFDIPESWLNNLPENLQHLADLEEFNAYPFGSDFDPQEQQLIKALQSLKTATSTIWGKTISLLSILIPQKKSTRQKLCLERMGLSKPANINELILARLLSRYL